jgi:hypothetical protein
MLCGALLLPAACVNSSSTEEAQEGASSTIVSLLPHVGAIALPIAVTNAAADLQTHGPARRAATTRTVVREGLPIYEPGIDTPVFYEIDLAPGWAIVRANGEALELGTDGQGPVSSLIAGRSDAARVVRLDMALYVAIDRSGKSIAQTSHGIAKIDRSGATEATLVDVTADQAIAEFPAVRRDYDTRMAARLAAGASIVRAADPRTCHAPGDVPKFRQISPNTAPNTSGCHSGCGPTAWAMIFGWASKRAAANPTADQAFRGLWRTGNDALGLPVVAPTYMNADANELTWTLREGIGTFCLSDQGATTPGNMKKARNFVSSRAPGVTVDIDYDSWFFTDDDIKSSVIDAICQGRPSIIGTGGLFSADMHYPVAKSYEDTWLWLEMGWGGNGDGWYQTGTWFKGNVHH